MVRLAKKFLPRARHKIFRHVAVVYRGGNVVAVGVNHDHIHAEVCALRKLWPSERVGTTVVSIRSGGRNGVGNAKPCPECQAYMREAGVKRVIYSDSTGGLQRLRLKRTRLEVAGAGNRVVTFAFPRCE